MPITLRAPAKINLYLRVLPRAADGYHPLRSWFRTIELFDELCAPTLTETSADALGADEMAREREVGGVTVQLSCSDPRVPTGEENLVSGAIQGLLGRGNRPLSLHLEKRILMGAGLGGGSSDAAAALALVVRHRPSDVTRAELATAAFRLGADVPFFLHHQLEGITDATCTGRGEIVHPFKPGRRHVVLLILPDLQVSTAEVYKRFDEMPAPPQDDEPDFAAWSFLPAAELLPLLRNDLERASFLLHPDLARLRAQAETLLGRPVRMSGSGSALFSLYDDREEAVEALECLEPLGIRRLLA